MAASIADNETWHVMIADDMKRMNVEQLDDAFRLSLVDASTLVWKAGMDTWQRLGSVAGLDEELDEYGDESDDTITRLMVVSLPPPPPPRPLARPAPKPPSPRRLQAAPPPPLAAPVYVPSVSVVAPVGLAPRAALPSEVDFRRKPRAGVRWGRWLLVGTLLAAAVIVAYRQNLLREGARRIGVEGKYLYGEQRVTAFIGSNAPLSVQRALGQLALLPGPNAEPPRVIAAPPPSRPPAPAQREVTPPPEVETAKALAPDSLPAVSAPPASAAPAPSESPVVAAPVPSTPAQAAPPRPLPRRAALSASPAPPKAELKARVESKPKSKSKAEPKPKPKASARVASDNPLKAAIRSAIAADAGK